ncbi:MAG: hypothetical protein HKN47_03385 [Pirellulaceae bacterium]|nr:hypothetical protein [Pirellulaceae bacterium]
MSPNEEQALDALLAEAHGRSVAPDLSREILAQLGRSASQPAPVDGEPISPPVRTTAGDSGIRIAAAKQTQRKRSSHRPWIAAIAILAASVMLSIWLRGVESTENPDDSSLLAEGSGANAAVVDPQSAGRVSATDRSLSPSQGGSTNALAENSNRATQRPDDQRATDQRPDGMDRDSSPSPRPMSPRVPLQGTPMIASSDSTDGDASDSLERPTAPSAAGSIQFVSQQIDRDWQAYWAAMGIEPTQAMTLDQTAGRVSQALGVNVSSESVADAKRLRDELVDVNVSRQIARRWLDQITGGGTQRLAQDSHDALIGDLATGIQSGGGFDRQFVRLLVGESDQTSAFYRAFANGGHDAMVRSLASVTMNVDLRCTKCHDSKIQGGDRQDSYWSFSTFLQRSLRRSRDGDWSVIAIDDANQRPAFYELPDGRQRFVEPGVDSRWIPSTDKQSVADVRQWSDRLIGSPELARGVVNSIWQMVHGRPLRSQAMDAITAPHHERLDDIETKLTNDLLASQFDVSRTLALVVAAPVSRRSVPSALLPANQLTASDDEILQAMNTVDAFAAALPSNSRLPMSSRLQIAMNSIGGKLGDLTDGDQLLANIADLGGGSQLPVQRKTNLPASVGYPFKASQLPVQWLASIKDYDQQVEHLGHLAGVSKLPASVKEVSIALRDRGDDDLLALHRVWWLLQP